MASKRKLTNMQVILIKGDFRKLDTWEKQATVKKISPAYLCKSQQLCQIGLGLDKAISCNRVDIWKGGSLSHSEINLLLWFPLLDHLYPSTPPLPLYVVAAGGVRKEWLWKCSLTRLLYALSKAQPFSSAGFPALSLVLVAKEPHSHELTHAASRSPRMEACCFIQRLLRFSGVETRCKRGERFHCSSVSVFFFFDHWKKWCSPWWLKVWFHMGMVDSHLLQLQMQNFFVRAIVNFLWMLLQFRENKYFSPLLYISSLLMLKNR